MVDRYYEKLYPSPEDNRSGDEMAHELIEEMGLILEDNNDEPV